MSKQRVVKDEIWDDDWFFDLQPDEKLLWLFLLTNPRTNIAGIYKLNSRWVATACNLPVDRVDTALNKFVIDGKIIYTDNWIGLVNFHKHVYAKNPSVALGIKRLREELAGCPQALDSVWHTLLNSTLLYLTDSESTDSQISSKKKLNMAWKNKASDNDDDLPSIDMDSQKEISPKEKPKRHYKEVYELFRVLGPVPLNWTLNTTEQKSAENLYTERGLEQIKTALQFYLDHKHLEYIPEITSPYSLDAKWKKLLSFKKKNG